MALRVAALLCLCLPLSFARKPKEPWRATEKLANRAWEAVTRGNYSELPRAHALFAQAFSETSFSNYDLYWESVRVATVGCLHAVVPAPEALHAVLDAELHADGARTGVSHMVAMAHFTAEALHRAARTWGAAFDVADAPPLTPPARPRWPGAARRARVGLLTAHFGDHPVGHHLGGLLRNVDATAWEFLCFTDASAVASPLEDYDYTRNAALCGGGGIVALPPGDAEGARVLADAGLDLLLTLDGYERGHRVATLATLARMPAAPFTIGWFGYLGTLGAPYIAGLLGDLASVPESDEHLFTEHILEHPTTFFVADYATLFPRVPLAPPYAPPPLNFTFCCFSQLWKVRPAVFRTWLSILERAPAATLLLADHPPVSRAGLEATYGGEPAWARVEFLPLLPRGEHLLTKRARCGLGLDTTPYNGHVTTADLLWAGVPVLTVAPPGVGMAGRAAGSIVGAAGAPPPFYEATSLEAYEDTAVRVYSAYMGAAEAEVGGAGEDGGGGDPLLWRPAPSAPLFDAAAWTRGFEATLLSVFEGDN